MKKRTIILQHSANVDFLNAYLSNLPDGGVFVQTTEDFQIGEPLEVLVVFPDIPEGVPVTGTVYWRRLSPRWRTALQPGIGIGFSPEDRNRVDFMLALAGGRLTSMRKSERRVPVDLKVEFIDGQRRIPGRARDISRGGISLIAEAAFWTGDYVEFDMYWNEQAPPERFAGHVVWCKPDDDPSGQRRGLGVKFAFRSPFRQRRILTLVNQLDGMFKDGKYFSAKSTIRA